MRVWSWDLAAEMISWVKVWIVSCMILGVEDGEQKVIIRLVRVGVSGSSMMGAETAIFSSAFVISKTRRFRIFMRVCSVNGYINIVPEKVIVSIYRYLASCGHVDLTISRDSRRD